jgi:hypothetical protein
VRQKKIQGESYKGEKERKKRKENTFIIAKRFMTSANSS